jgi:hypothetical protein
VTSDRDRRASVTRRWVVIIIARIAIRETRLRNRVTHPRLSWRVELKFDAAAQIIAHLLGQQLFVVPVNADVSNGALPAFPRSDVIVCIKHAREPMQGCRQVLAIERLDRLLEVRDGDLWVRIELARPANVTCAHAPHISVAVTGELGNKCNILGPPL